MIHDGGNREFGWMIGKRLKQMKRLLLIGLGFFLLLPAVSFGKPQETEEVDRAQLEHFESKIRPVLVERCAECHSRESGNSEGGLYLDSPAGMLAGGSMGPAIVPGKPEESLLIRAIKYADDDLQMPPDDHGGKLPDLVIADFIEWIRAGAVDPRDDVVPPAKDMAAARKHWAFQPLKSPPVPKATWPDELRGKFARPGNELDAFIVAKLQERGLQPGPMADRRTLIRRVTYDLTGLPPTFEQVEAFCNDSSDDAWEKVVERLLASAAYGERWGRHWLDVARYADTRGYLAGNAEERYAFAHTYRDYVIQAFNEDKPYDEFVREQIAADQLELGDDKSSLAAMGFLTLGRRFLGDNKLIIDDRIDVVTRGLMGLTVACARCHDHKFDPIPTADYYSLYGVFASSSEPRELPLLDQSPSGELYDSYLESKRKLEGEVEKIAQKQIDKFLRQQVRKTGTYLKAVHDSKSLTDKELDEFAAGRGLDRRIFRRWREFVEEDAVDDQATLSPWRQFWASEPESVSVDGALAAALETNSVATADLEETYNSLFKKVVNGDIESNELREFYERSPSRPPRADVRKWIDLLIRNESSAKKREIEALNWTHDGAPVRAHVLEDRKTPFDPYVFLRGNQGSRGPKVDRQFLEVLSGETREPFRNGSGRLELANAIASSENPLVARVFVNRVWGWHFGKPIVTSASDFGVRTEVPEQQGLLDWLSADFVDGGWSIKDLHRRILLSATWQQSSVVRPEAFLVDPGNQLMHSFNRKRIGFEAMRDSLLAVSGNLDRRRGGIPFDLLAKDASNRRTVYAFVERQNMPQIFRTFDFASPDTSSPGRFQTTVPQQALFLLNSPFMLAQSRALVESIHETSTQPEAQINAKIGALFKAIYQRSPSPMEMAKCVGFIGSDGGCESSPGDKWTLLAQTLLCSNELFFID